MLLSGIRATKDHQDTEGAEVEAKKEKCKRKVSIRWDCENRYFIFVSETVEHNHCHKPCSNEEAEGAHQLPEDIIKGLEEFAFEGIGSMRRFAERRLKDLGGDLLSQHAATKKY